MDNFSEAEILEHLAMQAVHIYNIPLDGPEFSRKPIELTKLKWQPSSLGALDMLPEELLQMICMNLDLLSLSRLSQTSHRAFHLVRGLSDYAQFLSAEKKDIFNSYAWSTVRAAIKSKCSCGAFTVLLFVLTCERYCAACLRKPSLWLITLELAIAAFNLQDRIVPSLTLKLTPRSRNGLVREVTTATIAKELASRDLGRHDSDSVGSDFEPFMRQIRVKPHERWSKTSLDLVRSFPGLKDEPSIPLDLQPHIFRGEGTIAFPSMSHGRIEPGFCCRSCLYQEPQPSLQEMHQRMTLSRQPWFGTWTWRPFAWPREEFLKHASQCSNAVEVMKSRWKPIMEQWIEQRAKLNRIIAPQGGYHLSPSDFVLDQSENDRSWIDFELEADSDPSSEGKP